MSKEFFDHLFMINEPPHTRMPLLVQRELLRQYYVSTLLKKGLEDNFSLLPFEDIEMLWKETFLKAIGSERNIPGIGSQPSLYTFHNIYYEIALGLSQKANSYIGTPTTFQIKSQDGKLFKNIEAKDDNLFFRDADKALWFIGKSDTMVQKYLKSFHSETGLTILEFDLDLISWKGG